MKKVLVIDVLTRNKVKKSLCKYDEIWYLHEEGLKNSENKKIKCILDYKSKNQVFFQKENLALQLCNDTYTESLHKKLASLHTDLDNIEFIHKKYQASYLTDFHYASIIKIFIDELTSNNQDIEVTYNNNHFLYSHKYPNNICVIRKLRLKCILRKLLSLNLHFGFFMYKLLRMKHIESIPKLQEEFDVMFYFDRKGQEVEWKYILTKLSEKQKIIIYYHPLPLSKPVNNNDLNEILKFLKNENIICEVSTVNDFEYITFKMKINYLLKGFTNYVNLLFDIINNFKYIDWYSKYFTIELDAIIYNNVLESIKTKRFITIGEYNPNLNLRTTMWKKNGSITENVVHGLRIASFENSFIYLDKIYIWDRVMEKDLKKMSSEIKEYVLTGPMYLHQIYDSPELNPFLPAKTIGIFSHDLEFVDLTSNWGNSNSKEHKKIFFEYILNCAKKHRDYNFMIIPHPRERQRGYLIEDFDCEMLKLPNVNIDFSESRFGSFRYIQNIDMGITMLSSIGFEMLFAGFKCIFFDYPQMNLSNYAEVYGDIFTNPSKFSMDEWSDFVILKANQPKEAFFNQYNIPIYNKDSLINALLNEA